MIPADAARDARARALVPQVKLWHVVTLTRPHGSFPAGAVFRQTPNGYRVNAVVCECDDYKRGHICKHIRAIVLAEQPAPSRYEALFARCRACGDLHEGRPDRLCERCDSELAYQERLAAKRAMVGAR